MCHAIACSEVADVTSKQTSSELVDATFEAMREGFVEDSSEEIRNLLSSLHSLSGSRGALEKSWPTLRRLALLLKGGAASFELPLIGLAAQKLEDYLAATSSDETRVIAGLVEFLDLLLDLLNNDGQSQESASLLLRRLPTGGDFDPSKVSKRDIEVLLVMPAGVAARVTERELRECGYRVTLVSSSFAAIELASRTLPNLAIVSAVMPDLSGTDLAIGLKAMPATRNIAVAVLTSLARDDASLTALPQTVPVIRKGASFGDDLTKALQDQFLI